MTVLPTYTRLHELACRHGCADLGMIDDSLDEYSRHPSQALALHILKSIKLFSDLIKSGKLPGVVS